MDLDLIIERVVDRILNEDSYTDKDIPPYFFLVTPTDIALKNGLADGYLDNFEGQGISDDKRILIKISYHDDNQPVSVIIMPGKETVRLNNLTRFMYDNPDYWLSGDLSALSRLYDYKDSDAYEEFGRILTRLIILENSKYGSFLHRIKSKVRPSQLPRKFRGLNHFSKTIVDVAEQIKEKFEYDYEIPDVDYIKNLILRWINEDIRGNFKIEGEWVSKSSRFTIPRSSIIIVKELPGKNELPDEIISKLKATYKSALFLNNGKLAKMSERWYGLNNSRPKTPARKRHEDD
ncbi:MAG: hypothetical protein WDA29_09890 [Flavobacteriaceae bacterium]